jgi:hypothetical protein
MLLVANLISTIMLLLDLDVFTVIAVNAISIYLPFYSLRFTSC